MSDHELSERIVRLETLIGDRNSGMIGELHGLRETVQGLKDFQLKVFGAFGVLAVLAQVAIQMFFR